ncbi:SDR family NAD(P)-dependent oxidoreductase [Rhodococcus globerulus]|jgi:3alpha(or 20beta)-hydroxysteroid dehydrogenase|uniref:SDR family NAD(P)-dependent oxidoreductase n=1 Tax=Rhodococcus globerulus TaxID=33008 RepID=UPI001C57086F|nr:glucose 1-dehydrogenase [Rhodococcus globerulus]QXW04877.1 glucose 1-dehydrogenase [Rhodococcus globerulus]
MNRFAGKVAIVTGGSQGMGEATARLLAAEGATVVIGDVLDEKGAAVAADIGGVFHHLDVSSESDWVSLVEDTTSQFGTVDVLINNAGMLAFAAVEDIDVAAVEKLFSVNVIGAMLGAKTVVPVMKKAARGVIVNISSVDGLRGVNGLSAYTASKWAVRGLTKTQALELGPSGIRVCSVHPGGVDTQLGNPMGRTGDDLQKPYGQVPLRRIGLPDEVARVTAFAASDDASYMSGAELAVDGGWSAGTYYPGLPGS